MWVLLCHVLEQMMHQNEKYMVWRSKCHWDDCSWFLSVAYGTLKREKNIPDNSLPVNWKNEIMGIIPVFTRTWRRGELWWKSCVSSSLTSYAANRLKQPVRRTHPLRRSTVIRMAVVIHSVPFLGPSPGWDHHKGNYHLPTWISLYCTLQHLELIFKRWNGP